MFWIRRTLCMAAALFVIGCSDDNGEPDAGGDVEYVADAADVASDAERDALSDADSGDEPVRFDLDGEPCELFEAHGPYTVGLHDVELDDGTALAVFYPAADADAESDVEYDMRDFLPEEDRDQISDEDAPTFAIDAVSEATASDDGPFPLVLFSHGLAGYRFQSSTLLAHLASWGFVVASAEHEERNLSHILESTLPDGDDAPETLREMIQFFQAHDGDSTSPFFQLVDLSQIAATGHSMGGNGAVSMIGEPGVEAAIFYASNPGVDEASDVELFWQGGTTDELVSMSQIRGEYESSPPTKRLLGIEGAGHLAFSDICVIGAEDGGVLQIASDSGMDIPPLILELGQDGCRDTDLDVEIAWPIIHHYSVAHLRSAFGIDDEPVGLADATVGCYADHTELEWAAE